MASSDEVIMNFPGGRKVVAQVGGHTLLTDQPVEVGGENAGPSPYSLFISSIGACAGFYALTFFQKRELNHEGLRVIARPYSNEGTLAGVNIEVEVPAGFPDKYRGALLRSIEQCSVKRAIQAQPDIRVDLTAVDARAAS